MTICNWHREEWIERTVLALDPLVNTVTGQRYGVPPLPNEQYRALAKQAGVDERARTFIEHLFPRLNEDPSELIDLLCRHPALNPNVGGSGNDLATFVVMPSGGSLLQLDILARYLTKSAMQRGSPDAAVHLENFLNLCGEGRVPGYEVAVFRGLTMSGEIEIAPGLEIVDYQRAAQRGLVRNEPPSPANIVPDYADMDALVLARKTTWGPCLVPPLTSKDPFPKVMPEFRWLPGRGSGIVLDLLTVCTSHQVQLLSMTYCAPEFADVIPGLAPGSGYAHIHGKRWSKKDLARDHVIDLQGLLRSWDRFDAAKRDTLELAVNRLASSIHRSRGRFWLQDRILDAAIALEIMYELIPPELTNKLATRAAYFLAADPEKRIEIFDRVHSFYQARSQIAHGGKGKRKGKAKRKKIVFDKAAETGFALASDTLRALMDKGDFPNWKRLIMSP